MPLVGFEPMTSVQRCTAKRWNILFAATTKHCKRNELWLTTNTVSEARRAHNKARSDELAMVNGARAREHVLEALDECLAIQVRVDRRHAELRVERLYPLLVEQRPGRPRKVLRAPDCGCRGTSEGTLPWHSALPPTRTLVYPYTERVIIIRGQLIL